MPGLIALGAQIVLQQGDQTRRMPLEDFYLAYQKTALAPGEFVRAVRVPPQPAGQRFRIWKVSKREDQDISAVCGAFALTLTDGIVSRARIAFGGVAATPLRARAAESFLLDKPWCAATVEAAMDVLENEYTPLSDMRASAAYRSQVTASLLRRFWLENGGAAGAPVRLADVETLA
jgi:xanthine dehydrogenase small subunit